MPVQDVYKFTRNGDDRRIVAGTIETGTIRAGQEVVFYPSGKRSHVKNIEVFHAEPIEVGRPMMAIGFTMEEQIYITRGELMSVAGEKEPKTASRILANVFWLGKKDLAPGKTYYLKIGAEKVKMEVEQVKGVMDSSNLASNEEKKVVGKNEVAECILVTDKPIAFDLVADIAGTSRFVIVDDYEIAGGGIITEALEDEEQEIRQGTMMRNYKWEVSDVSVEDRIERYAQRPNLIVLTGPEGTGKKKLAKLLERDLMNRGRYVYYMGIGSYLYGVGADTKKSEVPDHKEQIRRFGEVANLMLDAGMILIITATGLTRSDCRILKAIVDREVETIWVGDELTTDLLPDMHVPEKDYERSIHRIENMLKEKGSIFKA